MCQFLNKALVENFKSKLFADSYIFYFVYMFVLRALKNNEYFWKKLKLQDFLMSFHKIVSCDTLIILDMCLRKAKPWTVLSVHFLDQSLLEQ